MKHKKIPWWMPQVGDEEYKFIKKALDDNFVNEGPLAAEFEKKIAELAGAKYAVSATSGTAAIFLALKGLGIGPGDEVIIPDITFIATANAVALAGAKPVLVDVKPEDLTIDPEAVRKAVTPRTKAVIPVHVSGRGCDLEELLKIAKERGFFVVEDAAEALTSKYRGKHLGTFGETGCFSFAANKTVSCGQGGMVVTSDEKIYSRLKELKDQGRPVRGTGGDDVHYSVGYNFKFTDLQAGFGLGQLSHLKTRTERMKRNYELYEENLKNIKEVQILKTDVAGGETPQWTDALIERRDELDAHLNKMGMDCRRYWFPIHRQIPYRLPDDNFPVSTKLSPRALWLPSAFTLTDDDVLRVCDEIKKFFSSR